MKIEIRLLLMLLLWVGIVQKSNGRPPGDPELVYYTDPKIHTVLFFTEGWEFSLPVLELGSSQRLVLKFDELTREPRNFQYTLVHCDAGWNPSRVVTSEYMDGFAENPVNDYAFSINTTLPFVNYRLFLPNENVKILLSGNYLLKVWEVSHKDKPLLIRPFYVTERMVEISGEVQKATFEGYNGANQQMAISVNYAKLAVTDPLNEIRTVVMQNSRQDNRQTFTRPTFIRQNQVVYEDKINVFQGGNEFRNFNAKNLQTNGMGVSSIEYRDPFYHIFLERDVSYGKEIYRTRSDLNGNFLVKNDRVSDGDLESDYIQVHFSLAPPDQVTNDEIFVFGALSDWQCMPVNRMVYNPETKLYELTLLLKQGFYDYQYVLWNKEKRSADLSFLEGNHVDTENDYPVFVYYRGFSSRWDRLIGYKVINSIRR